jgi:large subunit ribosomal protein L13e
VDALLPIDSGVGLKYGISEVGKSDMPKSTEGGAYRTLRLARSDARLVGVRNKRAKAKADEADAKKK